MQVAKLLQRIRRGEVGNVDFEDLVRLVKALGFEEVGGKGSHRVLARAGVSEQVDLQQEKGQANRYQVRQVAELIRRYDLSLED